MNPRQTFAIVSGVTALVLGLAVSTPAAAATNDAVARAIVTTVLTNLGVDPSSELVDRLVASIPLGELDKGLVGSVGTALDAGQDASTLIGTAVDSDGDGIPNPDAISDDQGDDSSTEPEDDTEVETEVETEDEPEKTSGNGNQNNPSKGGTHKKSDSDESEEDD